MTPAQSAWVTEFWAQDGRRVVGAELGLLWDSAGWRPDPTGAKDAPLAASAYFAQPPLDAALSLALSRCDRVMLDEVAQYYLAAFSRFARFDSLARERGVLLGRQHPYDYVGDPETRTLRWIHPASGVRSAHIAECLLCVSQFLHPAARLIRLFAVLPLDSLNDVEHRFITSLQPLIVRDQILRFAFKLPLDIGIPGDPPLGAVAAWRLQLATPDPRWRRYPAEMIDTHLWLLAEAAEILAAHSAAPSIIPLAEADSTQLLHFVRVGLERMQRSETWREAGRDPAGRPVRELDLFEGEFSRHPDNAFAGDTSPALPIAADSAIVDSVGWDVGHAIRFPIVFRSLRAARTATGTGYPADSTVRALARQFLGRVYNGATDRPLFRNFMDGTDGWYRVGYAGRGNWGWAPSRLCNGQDPQRPCLGAVAFPQWGALARDEPALRDLAQRLVAMAASAAPDVMTFRERYYFSQGAFVFAPCGGARPSLELFELLAEFSPPATPWAAANP